jgi:hypothetical protein
MQLGLWKPMHVCFCAKISENSQLHALKEWKANNKNDYKEIICKDDTWV